MDDHLKPNTQMSEKEFDQAALEQLRQMKQMSNAEIKNYVKASENLPPHLQKLSERMKGNNAVLYMVASIEDEFRLLQQESIKKNRCSVSEYKRDWLFLHLTYPHSGCESEHEYRKKRMELSARYMDRFLTQYPIEIYEDHNPGVTVLTIPAMYRGVNTIHRKDLDKVDFFSKFGVFDRPDIESSANAGFMQATIDAQKMPEAQFEAIQARTFQDMLHVLRYFEPEHPLLKKYDESISNSKTEQQELAAQHAKGNMPDKTEEDQEVKIDLDDIGL